LYRFLSKRILKDFQLEKEVSTLFTKTLYLRNRTVTKDETFQEWQLKRKKAQDLIKSQSSSLNKAELLTKLENRLRSNTAVYDTKLADRRFCFQQFTTHFKEGKSPIRL
jgi:hypothetical protein